MSLDVCASQCCVRALISELQYVYANQPAILAKQQRSKQDAKCVKLHVPTSYASTGSVQSMYPSASNTLLMHTNSTHLPDTARMLSAVEEATIALVRLYQQFTFRLSESCVEPLDLRQAITMAPKGGVPVYVTQRAKA